MDVPFKKITLVGMGLMAGSLAAGLKRMGYKGEIIGVSRSQTLEKALKMNCVDRAFEYKDFAQAVRETEMVLLCTPIYKIIEFIKIIGANSKWFKQDCIISDVGSTKAAIGKAAKKYLSGNLIFIGGHPMAGSEKNGIEASDPFLYQNCICILTPGNNASKEKIGLLSHFWESVGAKVIVMQCRTHDQIAAEISHLPQLLAVSLVNMVADDNRKNNHYLTLAAGGFRDMTRIASSGHSIWKDILATNKSEIKRVIKRYIKHMEKTLENLEKDKLESEFEDAADTRRNIPSNTKGFLTRLCEILVVAEDKPGVIAAISNALAAQNINIKDIEVLKVREGEGGTIRLAFENLNTAKRAVEILNGIDVSARMRE